MSKEIINRCFWAIPENPKYLDYHDNEWGKPQHSDRMLFEMLILEGFQAGLSWECILNKRDAFRTAFDDFNAVKIRCYDDKKLDELMNNSKIVRNKLKIKSAVTNAAAFLKVQSEFGSFNSYIWSFTQNRIIFERCDKFTKSELSDRISKDLKKRGFKFIGSTIIYSYLQAIGIINGHLPECDCYLSE